jgi:sugar lactone lactonase YvrE
MKKIVFRYLAPAIAATVTSVLLSLSAFAAPGDIYDGETGNGTILKITPNSAKFTFATGLNFPVDIAFDAASNAYVADINPSILKFTLDGAKTTFATGFSQPWGLAFDSVGNLFVADRGANTIFKITPDGTSTSFATGLNEPTGLAFDASGNLFESDFASGTIFKFTPNGAKTSFATGLSSPLGLAFDSSGNLFEADNGSGSIFKFAPDGTKTTFATGLSQPVRVAFDASGNLFVTDVGNGRIFEFTPAGVQSTFIAGLNAPRALAFEPTPHQLFNISTRAFVGTGDAVLIGGFIVTGNGMVNGKVLVRAAGPSMTAQGVSGTLQDPVLRIFDSHATVIASNDNWKDTQQSAIQATGLAPTDDRESAILISLPAGAYTAIVTGAGNSTGIARVDVFNVQ